MIEYILAFGSGMRVKKVPPNDFWKQISISGIHFNLRRIGIWEMESMGWWAIAKGLIKLTAGTFLIALHYSLKAVRLFCRPLCTFFKNTQFGNYYTVFNNQENRKITVNLNWYWTTGNFISYQEIFKNVTNFVYK